MYSVLESVLNKQKQSNRVINTSEKSRFPLVPVKKSAWQ